jgi:hypothetical protein
MLNSVGIVILKAQKITGVDELQASVLEAWICNCNCFFFLIASFLPRIGYKRAMLIGLGLVSVACISMYLEIRLTRPNYFCHCRGFFALIKVSVYSLLGQ